MAGDITTIDEKYLNNFTKNLYKFLKNGHSIRFRKMRFLAGKLIFNPDTKDDFCVMILDPSHDILATLIHEYLHYNDASMSETQVIKTENKIVNALSERRVKNILKRFSDAL